jgi:hypothetical protein
MAVVLVVDLDGAAVVPGPAVYTDTEVIPVID